VVELLSFVEETRAHLELGYSSLFDYCTKGLGYSESAAYRRIAVSRIIKTQPRVLEELRTGKLNLTTAAQIAPLVKSESFVELVESAVGKTSQEVRLMVARVAEPRALPKEQLRVVTTGGAERVAELFQVGEISEGDGSYFRNKDSGIVVDREVRVELRFSIREESQGKLREAQRLLSGKYPRGVSLEELFEELLESYLERRAGGRRASGVKRTGGKSARACDGGAGSRYVPESVRREVYRRDGGECSYVGVEGKRCGSRWDLEIDHIEPHALGGRSEVRNLRLLCRAHNAYRAERTFGKR
jgi:hypothetical protein